MVEKNIKEQYNADNKKVRLKSLKDKCRDCFKCDLSKSRKKIVFSDGSENAKIMLIGEAPGATEDETGIPFVGRAGKLLDEILKAENITRKNDIYICNTIKCRPPENRVPTKEEKKSCREYLEAQIEIIKPSIILLCGATALKSMLNTKEPISKIRGKWFDGPLGSKMMTIFHPSYLLRNHSQKEGSPRWLMAKDIKEVRAQLDLLSK